MEPPAAALEDPDARRRRLNNERMIAYYKEHPDQAKRKSDRVLAKYHSDEAYRAKVIERARERRRRLRAAVVLSQAETSTAAQPSTET